MFRFHVSRGTLVIGLVLTAMLVTTMTLVVAAQGPDNGEPAGLAPESAQGKGSRVGEDQAGSVPGTITVVQEVEVQSAPASPNASLWFKFYTANTFVPYDDDMTYDYAGGGCTYRTGGTSFSTHDLQLPQGAEIDYLRIYYYDNDAVSNASAFLYAYDGYGNFTEIASVESSGTPPNFNRQWVLLAFRRQ